MMPAAMAPLRRLLPLAALLQHVAAQAPTNVCVDHVPNAATPAVTKTASRFDGTDDHVQIPGGLGVHCDLTIDTWVKFETIEGDHPIMNEDNWDFGDLHYQIYHGEFGFDVNGNGDYTYTWQPSPQTWYYITAMYSCSDHLYNLW